MTTRQRIAADPPRGASDCERPRGDVFAADARRTTTVEHVSRSVEGDAELLVAPPECRDCGFDGFDDPINQPSRCPECKSERIEEPAFVIR